MAALVWAAVRYRQSKATSLDLLRQERIRALNQEAVEIENEFKIVSAASGMSLVDNIIENLSQYRSEIEESIISIQARMADEDSRDRRELINQLQPVCAEGTELMSLLGRLAQV
jgi:predicted  nucleic acid-binding Zn-ribbon protein